MSYGQAKAKYADKDADKAFEPNLRACKATGCPLRATLDVGNGFCCSAHADAPADKWPRITELIHKHRWLATLSSELRGLLNDPKKGSWQDFASDYLAGVDVYLVPNADERKNADAYLYRLHRELMWRCGRSKTRPTPFEQKWWPKNRGGAALESVTVPDLPPGPRTALPMPRGVAA